MIDHIYLDETQINNIIIESKYCVLTIKNNTLFKSMLMKFSFINFNNNYTFYLKSFYNDKKITLNEPNQEAILLFLYEKESYVHIITIDGVLNTNNETLSLSSYNICGKKILIE